MSLNDLKDRFAREDFVEDIKEEVETKSRSRIKHASTRDLQISAKRQTLSKFSMHVRIQIFTIECLQVLIDLGIILFVEEHISGILSLCCSLSRYVCTARR